MLVRSCRDILHPLKYIKHNETDWEKKVLHLQYKIISATL